MKTELLHPNTDFRIPQWLYQAVHRGVLPSMKTEYHSMETELETADWPIDPAVLPHYMDIGPYCIEGMSWTRQKDGQLVSLTIHFKDSAADFCVGTYEKEDEFNQSSEP
jgi:hypothetical protein